jgi:hypothetical protein
MLKAIAWRALGVSIALTIPSAAFPKDFFQQAGENLRDAADKAAPIVAPGSTIVIQVVNGKKPGDAIKDTVLAPVTVFIDGQKAIGAADQQVEDAVKKALGPGVGKAIEIIRLPEKIERAVIVKAAETGLDAAKTGKVDPAKIAAIPLAALLQQAIDLYKSRGLPVPDTVQTLLSTTHTRETLQGARFVIDDNLGSLPSAINFLKEQSNDNFAVTVGNIIVFAKDPGVTNMHFWAHELQHTVQYRELGVNGFAAKYLTNSADLEADAEKYGNKAEAEERWG